MRHLHVWTFFVAVGWAASAAWGQGLYGSPEMLRLGPAGMEGTPQVASVPAPGGYAAPAGYASPPAHYGYTQPYPYTQPVPQGSPTALNGPIAPGGRVAPPNYTAAAPNAGYYGSSYDPGYANRTIAASPRGPALVPTPAPPNTEPGAAMQMLPAPQQSPNLVNQMLEESGRGGYGNGACGWGGASGWSGGGTCQPGGPACGDGSSCFQPMWYASAAGLFMTRDKANGVWTTYETNNNPNQLMRTTDADVGWRGGYEVVFGRRFGCNGCWAIEADYWAIDGLRGHREMSLLPGNTVSTPLMVDGIEFVGVNGTYFFDNAAEHALWRENRIQSIEVNFVRRFGGDCSPCANSCSNPCASSGFNACASPCSPFDLCVMVGPRYFIFEEELTLGSLANGGTWGRTGPLDEAYLSDHISNNLIGFQFGFNAGYRVGDCLRLFVIPKMGIYNNHIVGRFDAFNEDGVQANPTPASGVVGTYPVFADRNVFSFLGQVDVGLEWRIHSQWSAFAGYRLLAATGIGLADHQLPPYIVDIPALADPKHNGDLIVHGGFAGVTYSF